MVRRVSVRLDSESLNALRLLEASGLTRSEAVRRSLVNAAARMRDERALSAESAALEANEADQAEMRAVAGLMRKLRAPC